MPGAERLQWKFLDACFCFGIFRTVVITYLRVAIFTAKAVAFKQISMHFLQGIDGGFWLALVVASGFYTALWRWCLLWRGDI